MADSPKPAMSPVDLHQFLRILSNPDGSVTRLSELPKVLPTEQLADSSSVDHLTLSKDFPLNHVNNTFLRLFKPCRIPSDTKLPVIIYFHGGGFVFFSAASSVFHEFCSALATGLSALVLSLEYRLAPEHRLPAAYDDAIESILWLRDRAKGIGGWDPWLSDCADFSKCFLMGLSAGGNMVYRTALRLLDLDLDLSPLKIRGLIMNQPYFGGVEKTGSETRLSNDELLPLETNHMMWSLALPEGADRDHEYSNPMVAGSLDSKVELMQRCLVKCYGGDPLLDRQMNFAKMLEARGVTVDVRLDADGTHALELVDPEKARKLHAEIGKFVRACLELMI